MAYLQPFEYVPSDDFRAQIETNLFGVVNLTRAAITLMRPQGSGYIFQVSSAGGRISSPGLSAYQAAKWAVGGFSDVVGKEVAPFGIQVCTVEPGGMRTGLGTGGALDHREPARELSGIHERFQDVYGFVRRQGSG